MTWFLSVCVCLLQLCIKSQDKCYTIDRNCVYDSSMPALQDCYLFNASRAFAVMATIISIVALIVDIVARAKSNMPGVAGILAVVAGTP